ncbi:hypothetical protein AOB60_29400 [Streptomyces noursei]|uniref:Uncharacterized protein n=1 Tax=Streptomyces noursei TaxID=1971 RepID=A0A2N8PB22_STRNR|nr:hypothetical protein AOB60_29400 [Streptomyces noursei]
MVVRGLRSPAAVRRTLALACACLKVSMLISGSCTGRSDQIHWSGVFQVSLVRWPRVTSSMSRRTSSLRCLFQTS